MWELLLNSHLNNAAEVPQSQGSRHSWTISHWPIPIESLAPASSKRLKRQWYNQKHCSKLVAEEETKLMKVFRVTA